MDEGNLVQAINGLDVTVTPPFLLFLGDVQDARLAKTASGVYYWRRSLCHAQLRLPGCAADLELPDLAPAEAARRGAKSLLIGLAAPGGDVPDNWIPAFEEALRAGLDLVSGMHTPLAGHAGLAELARRCGRRIVEIRRPPAGLPVANGRRRSGRRLLTVGTDCGVGKMFAALSIEREMQKRGFAAQFRATGQTGIMIAGSGICIDAVISDFAAGAAEVLSPSNHPDHWDIIEGQGSLFHPSYAGVSLALLHGSQPDYIVMCHDATRTTTVGVEDLTLPTLEKCLAANLDAARLVNKEVTAAGICVNTSALSNADADIYLRDIAESQQLPVCDPVRTGVGEIVDRLV